MKSYSILILINLCFPFIFTFVNDVVTLNPTIIAANAFCIQDLLGNSSSGIFQNKMTKSLFYTPDGTTVTQLTAFNMTTFNEIKCLTKERVVLLAQNSTIYEYNVTSGLKNSYDSPYAKQINVIENQSNESKLVYVKNQSILVKSFPLTPLSQQLSYVVNTTVNILKCSVKRNKSLDGYCFFVPTNTSSLLFFHISHPQVLYQRQISGIQQITISETNQRIYVGLSTGDIKQYSMIQKGLLLFERETNLSRGYGIVSLVTNELRNELLYMNSAYKIGIINYETGNEVGFTSQLSTFSNTITILSLLSKDTIAHFNPSQFSPTIRLLNTSTVIINSAANLSSVSSLEKLCVNQLQYYNVSINQCQSCIIGCSLCDEESGACIQCENGYFMNNQICLSCKYASISQDYYSLCFEDNQITVLTYTNTITPALTSTIHYTYSLLSGSALLFLFLRFISFWSVVSVYYFLNIDQIPYFLLQILQKIFNILYGSVFQFFGIDISFINMGVKQKIISQKMISTQITTDFLGANFQSIILYVYSLLLICILYDGIKNWFKKFKIHLFENVKLEACLEEFVGMFISLLVPSYLFIKQSTFSTSLQKLNNALFIVFLGIGILFPFFFLILTLKRITLKKRIQLIRNSLKNKGLISQSTFTKSQIWNPQNKKYNNKDTEERLIKFLSQEEAEKFLYCLNCFWSPFLVSFESPLYFLVFGLIIHLLSLWNAFYAKEWRFNAIFGKLIFLLYHLSFVLMMLIPSQYFIFSITAFFFIIFGGVHQLISSVGQKIYFIFLVLKNKGIIKSNKIAMDKDIAKKQIIFDSSVQQKSLSAKISMEQVSSQNFQKSSLKNIDTTKQCLEKSNKKMIKKLKIKDINLRNVKNIFESKILDGFSQNQQKSLQNIDLTQKQIQQTRVKKLNIRVKFSNVENMGLKTEQKQTKSANQRQQSSKSQKENSKSKQRFKLKKYTKQERRVLFDQQFGQMDQLRQKPSKKSLKQSLHQFSQFKQNKQTKQTKINSQKDKNLTVTEQFTKKKVKFLKIDSTITKIQDFSKTQPQNIQNSFSIKQT